MRSGGHFGTALPFSWRLTSPAVPYRTALYCLQYAEPNVVGLYEKLGFVRDPEGIKGMAFQRRKKDKAPALAR